MESSSNLDTNYFTEMVSGTWKGIHVISEGLNQTEKAALKTFTLW